MMALVRLALRRPYTIAVLSLLILLLGVLSVKRMIVDFFPKIEVHLVVSELDPGGVGEPGTPPTAPALANALFQVTGKRIYTLPLSLQNFGA